MRAKSKKRITTSAELREILTSLSSDAVEILKNIMSDEKTDTKIKIDIAKYIISQVLDDPSVLQNGDNLVKLAAILKE